VIFSLNNEFLWNFKTTTDYTSEMFENENETIARLERLDEKPKQTTYALDTLRMN